AERQIDRRLLVARRRLKVPADQNASKQLLVLVVAERALGCVAEEAPNRLGALLGALAARQRAARQLVRHPEVAQRLAHILELELLLAVTRARRDQPQLGVDDRPLRGEQQFELE